MKINLIKSNPYVALEMKNEANPKTEGFGLGTVMKNTAEVIKTSCQRLANAASWASENKAKVGFAILGAGAIYCAGTATGAYLESASQETGLTPIPPSTPATDGNYYYPLQPSFSNLEEALGQQHFLQGMLTRADKAVENFKDVACASKQYLVLEDTESTGANDRGLGFYVPGQASAPIVRYNGTGTCHIKLEGDKVIASGSTLSGMAFRKNATSAYFKLGAEENVGNNNIFFAKEVNLTVPEIENETEIEKTYEAVQIHKLEQKTTCAEIKSAIGEECSPSEVKWFNV